MNINWIFNDLQDKKETKILIDKEFSIRTELSKLILNDPLLGSCDDLNCFYFNFDLDSGKLSVSSKTPEPYYSKIKRLLKRYPLIYESKL